MLRLHHRFTKLISMRLVPALVQWRTTRRRRGRIVAGGKRASAPPPECYVTTRPGKGARKHPALNPFEPALSVGFPISRTRALTRAPSRGRFIIPGRRATALPGLFFHPPLRGECAGCSKTTTAMLRLHHRFTKRRRSRFSCAWRPALVHGGLPRNSQAPIHEPSI